MKTPEEYFQERVEICKGCKGLGIGAQGKRLVNEKKMAVKCPAACCGWHWLGRKESECPFEKWPLVQLTKKE